MGCYPNKGFHHYQHFKASRRLAGFRLIRHLFLLELFWEKARPIGRDGMPEDHVQNDEGDTGENEVKGGWPRPRLKQFPPFSKKYPIRT